MTTPPGHPSLSPGGAPRRGRGTGGGLVAVVLLAWLVGGCVGLARPIDAIDARAITARAESEESGLARRVPAYDDARLTAYLTTIASRVLGPEAGSVRITVLEDPTLAAFALPNGRLYLHTGLLGVVGDEAELAMILAREAARAVPDPAELGERAMDGPLPRIDLSPTAAAILGLDLRLAAAAAIRGRSAARERGADAEALGRVTAAGYDGGRGLRIFERLAGDTADRGPLEIFYYGDRARMRERHESGRELLRTAASPAPAGGADAGNGQTFRQRVLPVVRDNAALDGRAGRERLAQAALARVLGETPQDPIAHVAQGDLYRLRSQRTTTKAERAEDVGRALAAYRRALELDPSYAVPLRQLGLLFYQEGDRAQARWAFARYLAAVPDARDAARIREYLALMGES